MCQQSRTVRVGFKNAGPILVLDKAWIFPPGESDLSRRPGEIWIDEDASYASVYLTVPFFGQDDLKRVAHDRNMAWVQTAERAYRNEHQGQNLVFRNTPSDAAN